MQSLFNDSFYQGPEEEQKPEFPDIDEELEIGINLSFTLFVNC